MISEKFTYKRAVTNPGDETQSIPKEDPFLPDWHLDLVFDGIALAHWIADKYLWCSTYGRNGQKSSLWGTFDSCFLLGDAGCYEPGAGY